MAEQEPSEIKASADSLNLSLCCALFKEKTFSQEQQSNSLSKVQLDKHSTNLQVQAHCDILEETTALKLLWLATALQPSVLFSPAGACCLDRKSVV